MKRKSTRANNAFLLGSLVMIVLVLIVVVLFLFLSFRIFDKNNDTAYNDRYEIVLGTSVLGNPVTVYLNDSLLFSGTPQSTLTLSIGRFAQTSTLLVVDDATDIVSTIELPEHSATVRLGKKGSEFFNEKK